MSLDIAAMRQSQPSVLVIGNHRPIVQSVLDFDYLCGKDSSSVVGIVVAGNRYQKYFWGEEEVLLPCFANVELASAGLSKVDWLINLTSGRRSYATTVDFFKYFPSAKGGHLFAEDIPELFATKLITDYQSQGKVILGPAGVGLIIPGSLKLGAVGGTDWQQIEHNSLTMPGSVAVLSASGGMINEIITVVCQSDHLLSFGLCFGGDRFPATSPKEAFLAAEKDPQTKTIVYYGELGGHDEYQLAQLLADGKITKEVICYIAGTIAESFDQPVQFGHAKALARLPDETASAKREALEKAGAKVAISIEELVGLIKQIPTAPSSPVVYPDLTHRSPSLFTSTISRESRDDGYMFVNRSLTDWAEEGNFEKQIMAGLLGREPQSETLVNFAKLVFMLSIDHGPQVSGAVNTIVTARAGKNMIDALIAGLTTIGPRFGGAVSGAAKIWLDGVQQKAKADELIESYARRGELIMGIGHKKYRVGLPDPRVVELRKFANKLASHHYLDFALEVEKLTTAKKGSLILNVDGYIAAILLDTLEQEENIGRDELGRLIEADFFNAFFVIPRSIGFICHYLDQKRIDEGLFRLPSDAVHLD